MLSRRYLLKQVLGKGASAVVYQATDIVLDQTVAVKLLLLDGLNQSELAKEIGATLRAEAKAAMRLSHPGILRVFNYECDDPWEYLVMEFVTGENLSDYRKRQPDGRLTVQEVLRWGMESAKALAYAHAQGIVHHDIKPHNIMLTRTGRVKICDFGLARMAGMAWREGSNAGTPAFLSPERISGGEGDQRSDLYSLAATLYLLGNGKSMYGTRPDQALRGHRFLPVPQSPHLPAAVHSVLERALQKDPKDRYHNAREMCEALARVAAADGAPQHEDAPSEVGWATVALHALDASQAARSALPVPAPQPAAQPKHEEHPTVPYAAALKAAPAPAPLPRATAYSRPAPAAPQHAAAAAAPAPLRLDPLDEPPANKGAVEHESGPRPMADSQRARKSPPDSDSHGSGLTSRPPTESSRRPATDPGRRLPAPTQPTLPSASTPAPSATAGPSRVRPASRPQVPDGMVVVPACTVISAYGGEYPTEAFAIDRFPVTNERYSAYLKRSGATAPSHWRKGQPPQDKLQHPVVGVTLEDAQRFAEHEGLRLPTCVEWEAAARSPDGRAFPWGDGWDPARCQCPERSRGDTAPVDRYPAGASPVGCVDLVGNVWEWTVLDPRVAPQEPGATWVLGGSYSHPCAKNGDIARTSVGVRKCYLYLGFRCAWSEEGAFG